MICRDAETMMSAYVDRELDVPTSLQMESHVAAVRAPAPPRSSAPRRCALRCGRQRSSMPAPPDLERRVRAAIRREAGRRAHAAAACLALERHARRRGGGGAR